ncbi:MAG: hypothetical protein AB1782_01430 [Cyanobacteriota bacterium]
MGRDYFGSEVPTLPDKLISAASYLTMGLAGFVWLIVVTIQKAYIKPFLKYHILQSIFLSVILAVLSMVFNIISRASSLIPVVSDIVNTLLFYLVQAPIIFGFPLLSFMIAIVVVYLTVFAVMGKYSYIPWFSDNIRQMI